MGHDPTPLLTCEPAAEKSREGGGAVALLRIAVMAASVVSCLFLAAAAWLLWDAPVKDYWGFSALALLIGAPVAAVTTTCVGMTPGTWSRPLWWLLIAINLGSLVTCSIVMAASVFHDAFSVGRS